METRRIALVTGAGSGIGKAIALALMGEGYAVALAGRRPEPLEQVAQAGRELGGEALVVPTDVSDRQAVDALFDAIRRQYGRLDLLFNNAGVFAHSVSLEELEFEEWQRAVDINLTGAFLCTQGAFRLMRDQNPRGGRIINNGSISAHAPRPNAVSYTATKHAITGLTKQTSLDGRKYDIACGQIDIGNAASDMTSIMSRGVPQADGSTRPEPRMDVQHVAKAFLYMASLPLEANVQFMTVMATKMPFIGRG
ncbi:SDR family oxidoreductase [Allopusillimonas soli]|uniref:SDR family oxidoreductase n=1 Tax=Allopusillimonas soli TaxID=659016 RepID=A0A853FD13_9BURK|nr:SDR family oxidoreductase [Allopusillimonas soli]NYT37628.1 SDR family oxidoreductase [Allopusillimonas soli]TEA74409.1 SDR family oxidoreductase [Allopusillimonas soli]